MALRKALSWSLLILFFCLNGCISKAPDSVKLAPSPERTRTDAIEPNSTMLTVYSKPSIPTITRSPTAQPIILTQPKDTAIPSPTFPLITATLTSTKEPLPTLSVNDTSTEINRLLSTNNNCSFPCWWGFTPGKTIVSDLWDQYQQFSAVMVSPTLADSQGANIMLRIPQPNGLYLLINNSFEFRNGVVETISVAFQLHRKVDDYYEEVWGKSQVADLTQAFNLSKVLLKYGQPSEIYVSSLQAVPMGDPLPLKIYLFYRDQGFLVTYTMDGALYLLDRQQKQGKIVGCPSLANVSIRFWAPVENMTFDDIVRKYNLPASRMNTIDDAIKMNIDAFYIAYKNAKNEKCIETPSEIWPLP